MTTAIQKAVQAVGSQTALARAVRVTPQAVQQWVETGRVSHKKVLDVERASGISRYELRPDIYPPQEPNLPHTTYTRSTNGDKIGTPLKRRAEDEEKGA